MDSGDKFQMLCASSPLSHVKVTVAEDWQSVAGAISLILEVLAKELGSYHVPATFLSALYILN